MNWFKSLFSKQALVTFKDIPITVDIHSHLLPGLDDGAQTIDESLDLIERLQSLGYKKLITTPHVMGDFYKNSPTDIQAALDELRQAVAEQGMDVEISAAAEYYFDEWLLDKVKNGDVVSFGDHYLLIETSFMNRPNQLLDAFFQIKLNGYKPVFAHPERYIYLYEDFERYKEIYEKGVYFQINLNSLTGYYSPGAKEMAETLIKNDMVDFVGTDAHRANHVQLLNEVTEKKIFNKLKDLDLLNETL